MDFNLKSPSRRKTSKILAIGNYSVMVIDIIQSLAFVPLYLTYIGGRMYGLWLGTGGVLAILAFMDMGIASLTIQRVSREYGKKNFDGISKYFSAGFLINACFMGVLLIAGIISSYGLDSLFPDTTTTENRLLIEAFQIALIAMILSLLNNTIGGTLNALQKPLMAKVFELAGAISGIVVTYVLLFGDQPLMAIPVGMLARSSIGLVPNMIYLTVMLRNNGIPIFNYKFEIVKDYLNLTPNLFLSKFGTSLVSNIEPTLINMFMSPEVAVFFSVTKKAGDLIKKVLDRIGGVLYPSLAHLYSEANTIKFNELFIRIINYIFPASLLLFLIYILLNEQFVSLWVGEENYLGDWMTILISTSLLFSTVSNLLSYLLSTTGDIKFASNSVFVESITKILMLLISLKLMGVYGLPVALILTGLIFISVYFKRWNKHLLVKKTGPIHLIKEHVLLSTTLIFVMVILYFVLNYCNITTYAEFVAAGLVVSLIMGVTLLLFSSTYKSLFNQVVLKKSLR